MRAKRSLPELVVAARTEPPTRGLVFELIAKMMYWKRSAARYRKQVEIERRAYESLLINKE